MAMSMTTNSSERGIQNILVARCKDTLRDRKQGTSFSLLMAPKENKVVADQWVSSELQQDGGSQTILVEGAPGTGKTTLTYSILMHWTLKDLFSWIHFVILIDCQRHAVERADSLPSLLLMASPVDFSGIAEDLNVVLCGASSKALLILDGFDTICERDRLETLSKSFLGSILKRHELPCLNILILTRVSGLEGIYENCSMVDGRGSLHGFSLNDCKRYLATISISLGPGHREKLVDYVDHYHAAVKDMLCNPSIAKAFVAIFEKCGGNLPETLTELFMLLVPVLMSKDLISYSFARTPGLADVPGANANDLNIISRLALHSILKGKLPTIDIAHFCIAECIPDLSLKGMNLFESYAVKLPRGDLELSYNFLHPSVQEFLAAYAFIQLPVLDQLNLCLEHASKIASIECQYFLIFVFGMTANDLSLSHYNPTKSALPTLVDALFHKLQLENPMPVEQQLFLLKCVWEAREPALWRKIASKNCDLFTLALSEEDITPLNRKVIASGIMFSGITQWQLVAPDSYRHVADSIQILLDLQGAQNIELKVTDGDMFVLKPIQAAKPGRTSSRNKTKQYFSFRCLRDTFHLILQLFSPISLHSSVSDTCYLNFISCLCMQDEVTKSVRIEPVSPLHWIQLPHKQKKGKHDNEADIRHLHDKHDGRIELVIISCPYPHAIHLAVFGFDEEIIVPLSSQPEPLFSDGEIAMAVSSMVENIVLCTVTVPIGVLTESNTDRVLPGLLLPGRKQSDSGYMSLTQTTTVAQAVSHTGITRPTLPIPISDSGGKKQFPYRPGYVLFSVRITCVHPTLHVALHGV